MSNLKTYLAEKYMSGPKADVILSRTGPLKKKKKRKAQEVTGNLPGGTMIRDEDAGWGEIAQDDDNDDLKDAVVANDRGFKKRKVADASTESSWITVQEGVVKEETTPPPADEQPILVDAPFTGGLVNAQQLKKVLPQNNLTNTMNDLTPEEIARAQETVYRDSSGKKIDTKAARAEAARLKRLREEKEAQKMEWGKGLVQKDEAEKRRQELEKQRGTAFARHADDKSLNDELKAKELWNDPAAAFLTVNSFLLSCLLDNISGYFRKVYRKGLGNPNTKVLLPHRTGLVYNLVIGGMALVCSLLLHPIRILMNILDRGNGFEKKLFQSQNSRKRKGAESYQWSVDDM